MTKIITPEEAITIATKLNKQNKRIVLTGGCFDILHVGHITFLEKARKKGDLLFVFVEHDVTINQRKGHNRPLNRQIDRAKILSSLIMIDYVILLPTITENTMYDNLVIGIKPAIIATTAGDSNRFHKERQAKVIGAQVIDVTTLVQNQSTTKLITILNEL